jgi:hypothetical protein
MNRTERYYSWLNYAILSIESGRKLGYYYVNCLRTALDIMHDAIKMHGDVEVYFHISILALGGNE